MSSQNLQNLYTLARRAAEIGDNDAAFSHYSAILLEDPNSWEATLYSVYYGANGELSELKSLADRMTRCIPIVIQQIEENVLAYNYSEILTRVNNCCNEYSIWICENANMHHISQQQSYNEHSPLSILIQAHEEFYQNICAAADILYTLGNCIERIFDGNEVFCAVHASSAWRLGNEKLLKFINAFPDKERKLHAKSVILSYVDKIKKYDDDYQEPEINVSGCYIATAVYGSYDCPQVWTLRRFRDNVLAKSWVGHTFIRIYYIISPILVKHFGHNDWFKRAWRLLLDRMVKTLNSSGFESSPYQDKIW